MLALKRYEPQPQRIPFVGVNFLEHYGCPARQRASLFPVTSVEVRYQAIVEGREGNGLGEYHTEKLCIWGIFVRLAAEQAYTRRTHVLGQRHPYRKSFVAFAPWR